VYTYLVGIVNSRCLNESTVLKNERINSVYLPNSHSQVALLARDTHLIHIVNLRCLHETTPKVEPIDRIYLPNLPSQLALFARDNF
jgi:hypothetical protein